MKCRLVIKPKTQIEKHYCCVIKYWFGSELWDQYEYVWGFLLCMWTGDTSMSEHHTGDFYYRVFFWRHLHLPSLRLRDVPFPLTLAFGRCFYLGWIAKSSRTLLEMSKLKYNQPHNNRQQWNHENPFFWLEHGAAWSKVHGLVDLIYSASIVVYKLN